MKTYVEYFHPRLVGLTGSIDQVKAVAKAYKAYFTKSGDGYGDDDYSVDHSSITYLMAPDGKFVTHFSHGVEAEAMAKKTCGNS
jgi:protein SCO1/2